MKFKIGQTVVLINNDRKSAKLGAIATIYRRDKDFIYITWKRDSLSKNQGDGGYYPKDFKPILEKGEQLEFAFMLEA